MDFAHNRNVPEPIRCFCIERTAYVDTRRACWCLILRLKLGLLSTSATGKDNMLFIHETFKSYTYSSASDPPLALPLPRKVLLRSRTVPGSESTMALAPIPSTPNVVILVRVFTVSLDIPRATRTMTRENTTPCRKVSQNSEYSTSSDALTMTCVTYRIVILGGR